MRSLALTGALVCLLAAAGPAAAVPINYGNHLGTDVTFVNVSEDSGTDPVPLFGAPTVTGNSIDFNPLGFDATATNGASDITDSNLTFMVTAHANRRIDSLTLNESGDTTMAGNVPPGSMGTATAVFASGVLDIHEVDFAGINHITIPFAFTFNPSGGTYFLGTDGGGGPFFNTQWTGSVTLDIDAILIANGITTGGATKISIDLDNTLTAVTQTGTTATIGKKDFGGVTITTEVRQPPVPEPASLGLGGVALAALAQWRRRPRAS
jgi:hypothetical protein